jgi:hypothetical protein
MLHSEYIIEADWKKPWHDWKVNLSARNIIWQNRDKLSSFAWFNGERIE